MSVLISTVVEYWIQYVFGSVLYSGIILMMALMFMGLKRGWSLDIYMIIFTPLAFLMANSMQIIPSDTTTLFVIGLGLIFGFILIRLVNR